MLHFIALECNELQIGKLNSEDERLHRNIIDALIFQHSTRTSGNFASESDI